jgi:serine/threonine protein kinase
MSSEGEIRPGHRLDRYELICPIAEGGMARVWIARQLGKHGFEKLVAIKTILPALASEVRFQQMFLDEARLASAIEHTNVARILDVGEEHDVLYIVMEWIDGESLNRVQRSLARTGVAIPNGVLLRVMADVCAGLHAAHELRDRSGKLACVVHRDVSPQNILISTDGVSKIIDFGIAKALDRASADTTTGTIKGKIQFMAPEQAVGQPIDRRADVWAVGAVLYNFFAGRPIYDDDSQLSMLHKLTLGVPPPPLPSRVPASIANVILGALQHDPKMRWSTTEQMQFGLEGAMVELGSHTTASGVAAFLGQHFGDRAVARRRTIDMATAAVRRLQSSSSGAAPPPSLMTAGRTPTPIGVGHGVKDPSSASLGSAAMDALPQMKRSRRGMWIAGAAAVSAIAGFNVLSRYGGQGAPSTTAVVATESPAAEGPAEVPIGAPSPPTTGVEPSPVTPPPQAEPSATHRPPVVHAAPAWRPSPVRPSSAPTASKAARKVADDGF